MFVELPVVYPEDDIGGELFNLDHVVRIQPVYAAPGRSYLHLSNGETFIIDLSRKAVAALLRP